MSHQQMSNTECLASPETSGEPEPELTVRAVVESTWRRVTRRGSARSGSTLRRAPRRGSTRGGSIRRRATANMGVTLRSASAGAQLARLLYSGCLCLPPPPCLVRRGPRARGALGALTEWPQSILPARTMTPMANHLQNCGRRGLSPRAKKRSSTSSLNRR